MKKFKHKCDLQLLMCEPNPFRPDRVTVGFVLRDLNGDPPIVEVRIAEDLRAVQCVYPDSDIEALRGTLLDMKPLLETVTDVERYLDFLPADLPADLSLISKGAVLTDSIEKELSLLEAQYVRAFAAEKAEDVLLSSRQADFGRAYLQRRINEEFRGAGVLNHLDQELPVEKYTFKGDKLRIDFGFQPKKNSAYRFFHAVSLVSNLERSKNIIHTWNDIRNSGKKQNAAEFVAIVEKEKYWMSDQAVALRQWMQDAGMQVQPETRMAQIAMDVRTALNI